MPVAWPPQAAEATHLVMSMVVMWAAASNLACAASRAASLEGAGLPGRGLEDEKELEDMIPLEPLWDVLWPLLGLGVNALGVQLTLGFSLMEPLLLLTLPTARSTLREVNDRLVAWHLGGLFGHPMLVAQIAVARSESEVGESPIELCNRHCAAFGALVGAYAVGAAFGSAARGALRRTTSHSTEMLRTSVVLLLVFANVWRVVQNGRLLNGPDHSHHDSHAAEVLRLAGDSSRRVLSFSSMKRHFGHAATHVYEEVSGSLVAAYYCLDLLITRLLLVCSSMIIVGSAPLPAIDLFAFTPLSRGLPVLWFDIAGVLTAGLMLPILLCRPLCFELWWSLKLTACTTLFSCLVAAIASSQFAFSSFELSMAAGLVASGGAAFSNAALASLALERLRSRNPHGADGASGAMLGWGLFAGGVGQLLGVKLGEELFYHFSWLGVSMAAGGAAALARCLMEVSMSSSLESRRAAQHSSP